ncbi:VPS35 endosomal protein-sorting factor-like [Tubulanus polymorphus]|uniref:VPS35 endosomal protein-sorting factor-like n=1 Tax=Tubulanus polymorphus TaxID=672921 RepID=UPI003DA4C40B
MANYVWIPRKRNYSAESKKCNLPREDTATHPLKAIVVSEFGKKSTPRKGSSSSITTTTISDPLSSLDGLDPLSQFAADPLTRLAQQASSSKELVKSKTVEGLDETFEPWSSKRISILNRYTTSEKLSITTSFLGTDKDRVVVKSQVTGTVTEKVKNRLEQLDDFEEGSVKEMLNLSQQEYVHRIDELNQALITAWDQDQRVKALKIAIQCAKLLSDTNVIQFYPSKFVLITDILDTFGRLVYDRIRQKSMYIPKGCVVAIPLEESFKPDQVPESAKETCRNWFFKIASIRELIPRFYVETAILKCYSFLASNEFADALSRLALMTRGIGDPLVSLYTKAYLTRVGMNVAPNIRGHLMPCFQGFLLTYHQIQSDNVQNTLAMQNMDMPHYMTLFSPALDWVLQCIAHNTSEKTLMNILQTCKEQCNSALLLNSIMSAFKPEYIATRATQFTNMIKDCEETGFPKHLLHRTLGLCLVMADPPEDQKLAVLNEVWKVVMKLKNPADYVGCAEVWIEYVVKHFGKREINAILSDIIKHLTPDRVFEDYYSQLQSIMSKVLVHVHDFSLLFSVEKFLPFIDMFQKDVIKVEVCKNIMDAFIKHQQQQTNDPVITNALMFICKTMHDSINALTSNDEGRAVSRLICGFVSKISFGRDFEQQLSFYMEARSTFTNLDAVLIHLVQCVNTLSMDTRQVVRGNHTRKTSAFVRACAAYCFITIPSLHGWFSQLNLYIHSGQVAMLNQCLSQADAFFKAAISVIANIPKSMEIDGKFKSTEPLMVEFVNNFLSTLLVVQDSPDQVVLCLLRGLLNALDAYSWESNSDSKIILYMNVLNLLSSMSQETYLYHVNKVDSNDAMYGSDPKFLNEVSKICKTLIDAILNQLSQLENSETSSRQTAVAFEFFKRLLAHVDMSNQDTLKLAVKVWSLANRQAVDMKQVNAVKECIKKKSVENRAYADLLLNMNQLVTKV